MTNTKNCAFCNAMNKSAKGNIKLFVLIPALLFVLASIIYLIFGANLGYYLQKNYTFSVDYRIVNDASELENYSEQVTKIVEVHGFLVLDTNSFGESVESGLIFRFSNTKNYSTEKLTEKFDAIKLAIEETYNDVPALIVSDVSSSQRIFAPVFWKTLLTLSVFALVYFVYMLIRFELISAISAFFSVILANLILFSLTIVLRIPVLLSSVTPFVIATLVTVLFNISYFSYIKQHQTDDDFKKMLNSEFVEKATENRFLPLFKPMIFASFALLLGFIAFLVLKNQFAFTILLSDIALSIALFCGVVFPMAIWSRFYNRQNDLRLKNRIERLKEKEKQGNKKDGDEKLVV